MILQRINLGLFALLGELSATADWRCIAEEIWPFVQGPPCTPMGAAEAAWRASRTGADAGPFGLDYRVTRAGARGNKLKGRRYLAGV